MDDDKRRAPQFSFGGDHRPGTAEEASRGGRLWAVLGIGAVLAAAGAAAYYFYPDTIRNTLSGTPLELPSTQTHAYKWKDASGAWHLTDSPPAQGIPYEKITVRSDTNILPPAPEGKR